MPVKRILFISFAISCTSIVSCSESDEKVAKANKAISADKVSMTIPLYDSVTYSNVIFLPDTAGCWKWVWPDIPPSGTLTNEPVIIARNGSYRVLKYRTERTRLWPCNLPAFLKDADTIIVTGLFQKPGNSECGLPGYPTLIEKIAYKKD